MANDRIPVDRAGGVRESGPWPGDVDELVQGEQYDRPVSLPDEGERMETVEVMVMGEPEDAETGESDGGTIVAWKTVGGNDE